MTEGELHAIRTRLCPGRGGLTVFARSLGYSGKNGTRAYRRYEAGTNPVPRLLAIAARLLDERGALPDWMLRE
jgi:hypothetical protein